MKIFIFLIFLNILTFGQISLYNNNIIVNGSDSTNITGNLHVSNYILPEKSVHSFVYFPESTISFTFALTATWYHLTNATNDLFSNTELDGFTYLNDTLIVTGIDGDYIFNAALNFSGTVNQTIKMRFYNVTKGAGIPVGSARDGSGTDIIAINVIAYAEDIDINDKIILQIQNADGTSSITLKSGSIYSQFIHD